MATSLDEFIGDGDERAPDPLDLAAAAKRWEQRLGGAKVRGPSPLAISAFTLIRGGDRFERSGQPARSDPALVDTYQNEHFELQSNGLAEPETKAATRGLLEVLRGHPAVLKRMLLAKPLRVELIPKGKNFRRYGFPRHTNNHAAGIFWNAPKDDTALIGLREEHILLRPHLMTHEMTHAVHLLGLTTRERDDIDRMLLPVYRSRRWIEEAVAIYAERAFGAQYSEDDLNAPGLYGKTRRDWDPLHVFSLFIAEWLRPAKRARPARAR